MRIENLRYGHATNSSSTHSVVVAREPVGEISARDSYGWDCFRLVTRESKRDYMIAQLKASFRPGADRSSLQTARFVSYLREFIDDEIELDDGFIDAIRSIDHQSVMELPKTLETADERAFWRSFFAFMLSDDVVIVGGNDNMDDNPALDFAHARTDIPLHGSISKNARIKRHSDTHWTIFSPERGNKIRIAFDVSRAPLAKGLDPELVDVKITDYCPFGCSFCYQSSTKNGRHADLGYLKDLFAQLARRGVFEVALGGGEPTMHPDFIEILRFAKSVGLNVNFTTFSKKWLKDEAVVAAVKNHVSGIGVSVHDLKGLETARLVKETVGGGWPGIDVAAQHVFGSLPEQETLDLVRACAASRGSGTYPMSLLLLGWKSFGFATGDDGHDLARQSVYEAIGAIYDECYGRLAIDTAMVERHGGLLTALGTHPSLVTPGEGRFSAYVDAVARRIAASSYTNETLPYDSVDDSVFAKAWARF